MAQLKIESTPPGALSANASTVLTDLTEISRYLSPLDIELSHWPIEKTEAVGSLLHALTLTDEQKEELLVHLDARFYEQQKEYGYQSRDLVVLHSDVPKLDDMLKMFDRCHKHADDEVRYIVDGSGIFGFIMPNGEQVMLTVTAEEFIRVPADTEHWFILDEKKCIKAVRYFTNKEGWVADYTGTDIHVKS